MRLLWPKKYLKNILKFIILISIFSVLFICCKDSHDKNRIGIGRDFLRVRALGLFKPEEVKVDFDEKIQIILEDNSKIDRIEGVSFCIIKNNEKYFLKTGENKFSFTKISINTINQNIFYGKYLLSIPGKIKRKYFGGFEVSIGNSELNLVVLQKFEDMVCTVLSSESNDDEFEYLKALAIIIRTYIFKNLNRHQNNGYDFCDNTHCQLFWGEDKKNSVYLKATKLTEGNILTIHSTPIDVYFTGCCGGKTVLPERIWNNYTRGFMFKEIDCKYCLNSKYASWFSEISQSDLFSIFGNPESVDDISITIAYARDSLPVSVSIKTSKEALNYSAEEFRLLIGRKLGWNKLYSNKFILKGIIEKDNKKYFLFTGKGFGHCAGFCQAGAEEMSRNEKNYIEIINYYYPDCDISTLNYY